VPRRDSLRALRNRTRIAQVAARLIAEHGLTDWRMAKRKACHELGLPDHEALPGNDEIEQALRDYNSLFHGTTQPATLRAQRAEALRWMGRLSRWDPVLTGAVAAGWATAHSEVRLELEAEDPKAVELELINADVAYSLAPEALGGEAEAPQLRIDAPATVVRLVILSPQQRRSRPRRERPGTDERLTLSQLSALLAADDSVELIPGARPQPPARSS